jgi:hypothetical protein
MIHSCHLLPDFSLRLAGLKGSSPLTPAAAQAFLPEALAEKLSTEKFHLHNVSDATKYCRKIRV